MKKTVLTITLVALCASAAVAQRQSTSAATDLDNNTSVQNRAVNLQSGTRLTAQLQQTLDARKLREGDQVVLKTTEAIKSNGRTVVGKGARLIGRVTRVQQKSRTGGESSISLLFDRLENGSLSLPINATITSITYALVHTRAGSDDDTLSSDTTARSNTSARSSNQQSSGGLLGGATGTVGGVLDTTTQTAGSVVNGTTGAVGNTAGGVTSTVGGIRITQSTNASAEAGSTLSLRGDNLRLEKGTSFRLVLNEATDAGVNQ
jgi:hypothetical protein